MTEQSLSSSIQGQSEEGYGDGYRQHVLEMWKTYLEMADHISERRERANAFFLTVQTGAFAGIGFLLEKQYWLWLATVCLVAGVPLSFLWYRLLRSYRDLNTAKFKVVHEIEQLLPLRLYDAEWEAVGRGKDPKRYLPFTHIELKVPLVFLAVYCVLELIAVYVLCCRGSA